MVTKYNEPNALNYDEDNLEESKKSFWKNRKKFTRDTSMIIKKYWNPILLAQILSFILCGTGVVNTILAENYAINIPTAQSFFNYVLLALIFIPSWFKTNKSKHLENFKHNSWKYFLIAFVDVEANYFIIKAYSLTIVTTIQVIDAFVLPIAVLLSFIFLKQSFKLNHIIGIIGCLFGCAFIIYADFLFSDPNSIKNHRLEGDLYCLLSSVLYALSNVGTEFLVKKNSKQEYLGFIGVFGSIISLIQMLIFEKAQIDDLLRLNSLQVWLLFLIETVFMFSFYVIIPRVIELSSAAFMNINLLTSDFYTVIYGILIKKYKMHNLYFVGFGCILLGTILYCLSDPKMREKNTKVSCELTIENSNELNDLIKDDQISKNNFQNKINA